MSRENTVRWSRTEERNLLPWLYSYRKLSWKARSQAYLRQFKIPRSGESLRGKQNDLLRKLRRAMKYRASSAVRSLGRVDKGQHYEFSGTAHSFFKLAQRAPNFGEEFVPGYSQVSGPDIAMVSWKPRPSSGSNERILLLLQYLQPGRSDCLWTAILDRLETAKRRG